MQRLLRTAHGEDMGGVGGEAQRAGELPLPMVEVACTSSGGQSDLVKTVRVTCAFRKVSVAAASTMLCIDGVWDASLLAVW
jgi:hypothetical protein